MTRAAPVDEQRESRGARGSRLLRWQRDRAAKLITRACPRVIWQSQRCVISRGEARVLPASDRRPATRPGPGRKRARRGSCGCSARKPGVPSRFWDSLVTSSRPSTYLLGAPPGNREYLLCAGDLSDHEPGLVENPRCFLAAWLGTPTYCRSLGLRLGPCAHPWRVAAHFERPSKAIKGPSLQVLREMARPGLEPGTPRFSDEPDYVGDRQTPAKRQDQIDTPQSANLASSVNLPSISATRQRRGPSCDRAATWVETIVTSASDVSLVGVSRHQFAVTTADLGSGWDEAGQGKRPKNTPRKDLGHVDPGRGAQSGPVAEGFAWRDSRSQNRSGAGRHPARRTGLVLGLGRSRWWWSPAKALGERSASVVRELYVDDGGYRQPEVGEAVR